MDEKGLNIMIKNHLNNMERELKIIRKLVHQNHYNVNKCDDTLIPLQQALVETQKCLESQQNESS